MKSSPGGVFGIRYNNASPAPFQIDSNNQNRVVIQRPNPSANDFTLFDVERTANHSGGTAGFVNSAAHVQSIISAGDTNYEWGLVSTITNNATAADNSQNVAIYGQAIKNSTGGTWASTFELRDENADPVKSSVATEIDLSGFTFSSNAFKSNGFIVSGSGNFGIGTTTPVTLLHINGNNEALRLTAGAPRLEFNNTSVSNQNFVLQEVSGALRFRIDNDAFNAAADQMTITHGGNVGIATTTPWRTLSVTGTVGFDGVTSVSTNQSAYLCLSSNKEVVQDSTTCLASSARFKQNIDSLSASSSLAEVMALTPVSFQYTPECNGTLQSDPNFSGTFVGFIAEDVAKVDPRLITIDATGTTPTAPHGVRYENITAILTGAIKQIAGELAALEQTVAGFANSFTTRQLCVADGTGAKTCITKAQLDAFLAGQGAGQGSTASSSASSTDAVFTPTITITDVPPDTATTTADTSSTATTTPEATSTTPS
jgi:hypothetical protein